MRKRTRHVARSTRESFLRRNAPGWRRRHPGSDGWQLSPPIPGTQVGQDLYIARTRPRENGYPDFVSGYAIFASRAKAVRGSPEDALAFYHDVAGVHAAEKHYGGDYKFHRLVNVRGAHGRYRP